jgi:hypothetical protein
MSRSRRSKPQARPHRGSARSVTVLWIVECELERLCYYRVVKNAHAAAPRKLAQRATENQRSRDEDARRLREGEVTPEQLRVENSFFNLSLAVRIVDFGQPLRRRRGP